MRHISFAVHDGGVGSVCHQQSNNILHLPTSSNMQRSVACGEEGQLIQQNDALEITTE